MRESKRLYRIKVVFVDWHKTLCSRVFFQFIKRRNKKLFDKLEHRLFEEMPLEKFIDWMKGALTKEDILKEICQDDLNIQEISRFLQASCEKMKFDRPDYKKWIKRLREKGKKVVIATDNVDVFEDYTVPALKLHKYFDAILCSSTLKCLKHDAKNKKLLFFDDFLRNNNIKYEEAILLDDDEELIRFCKKFGMQGKVVSSPENMLQNLMMIEACCDRCEF